MSKILLITAPDKIHNLDPAILLICPSAETRTQLQDYLEKSEGGIRIFMYSPGDPIDWLLDVFQIADDVVLELDECTEDVSKLASYFIANAKTKWLTTHDDRVYSKLSVNRIYDMSWLWQTEGELFPNE